MEYHAGMSGVATVADEALCPPSALRDIDRPDLGRGRWYVRICDISLGGCGRQQLPAQRPPERRTVVPARRVKPWSTGPAPWAR